MRDALVYVLLFGLIRIAALHHTDLLVLIGHISHLNLLDNLFVLKVDGVHFSAHF